MKLIYVFSILVLICKELQCNDVMMANRMAVNIVDNVIFLAQETSSLLPGGQILERFTDQVLQLVIRSCEIVPPQVRSVIPVEDIQIEVINFKKTSTKSYKVEKAANSLSSNRDFMRNNRTVIYVYGWRNTPYDESTQAIVKSLVNKGNINVLVLDTNAYFARGYVQSVRAVQRVSDKLYKFMVKLISKGVAANTIEIVGFSIGAHIAGIAGRRLYEVNKAKIDRITALDPAGPCFTGPFVPRLNKDAASYVEVIHTSPGTLGYKSAMGHADFYVNGVSGTQPDCDRASVRIACSHSMSWMLYSKSVNEPGSLVARKCSSWRDLKARDCRRSNTIVGFGSKARNRGLFLFVNSLKAEERTRFNAFRRIRRFTGNFTKMKRFR